VSKSRALEKDVLVRDVLGLTVQVAPRPPWWSDARKPGEEPEVA
jgi:hypothetical protein